MTARTRYSGDLVLLERLQIQCEFTETVAVESDGANALLFNRSGVVALSVSGTDGKQTIASEGNISLVSSGIRLTGLLTAGQHSMDILSWKPNAIPGLDRYLAAWRENKAAASLLVSAHMAHISQNVFDALDQACDRPFPRNEFDLLALVLSVVPALTLSPGRVAIAPNPRELPDSVKDLVAQVRADPSKPWSLTDASYLAGYSSFHFSRTFKQLVGCGFHEFVDRCRTEIAIEKLTGTAQAMGVISAEAGFPSVRAMRESIRDYLGLTVGDLRGLSDRAS